MWDFEHGDAGADFEIQYTTPSACAAALAANRADIGIIPAFTYAQIPDLVILPNIAIASQDRVRSILLVSKVPIEEVKTVAADTSSRTSVALLQILFTRFFGGKRELTPHPPQLQEMLREHDGALLIGDAALVVPADAPYYQYDLAHLWRENTGKPFVFAFWAVRLDALDRKPEDLDLAKVFQNSRDHGLQPENIATLAREWAPRLALSEADIRGYLTENIDYYLGRTNHGGLKLFLQYAQELELIPSVPDLRFLGPVAFGGARR
jgi:chorismate dehydratase